MEPPSSASGAGNAGAKAYQRTVPHLPWYRREFKTGQKIAVGFVVLLAAMVYPAMIHPFIFSKKYKKIQEENRAFFQKRDAAGNAIKPEYAENPFANKAR